MKRRELIDNTKRVVIKIGTSIISQSDGTLDSGSIEKLTSQVAALKEKGLEVIVVSSGAIAAGIAELKLKKRPTSLSELQACAAVGQSELMQTYSVAFRKRGIRVAQILLTAEDLRSRIRYLNARNTIFSLLEDGVIPIVNENDTVAVDEIKFGDNDKLSALVTNLVQADLLIILSDIDGFYQPAAGGKTKLVEGVAGITKEMEDWCHRKGTMLSTGGMLTKLQAAKIVTRTGEGMIIANGRKLHILQDIFSGKSTGTFFEPQQVGLTGKKRWLAFFTKPQGTVVVDKGAREALVHKGKSLLASGITDVKGRFNIGDVVTVVDTGGTEFARGLVNYSADEIQKIKGHKTTQIASILGYKSNDEVIHRNNIVTL